MEKIKFNSQYDEFSDLILYEGDALDLLSNFPDEVVQLVVTSPPYNLNKAYEEKLDLDTCLN